MGDDTDLLVFCLQDRALFDMVFEHRMDAAIARSLGPAPADAVQFVAEPLALGIGAAVGVILGQDAGEHARCQHGRRKTAAFLVRPVHDHDGAPRGQPHVADRPDHLQPRQYAKHAVVFAPRWLRIQVAADINRIQVGFRAFKAHEHIAHAVQTHGHSRIFAPPPEQGAAFGIGIGQGLAVVAARHAGADPGHLHQAVPQPFAVDPHIGGRKSPAGIAHPLSFLSGCPVLARGWRDWPGHGHSPVSPSFIDQMVRITLARGRVQSSVPNGVACLLPKNAPWGKTSEWQIACSRP